MSNSEYEEKIIMCGYRDGVAAFDAGSEDKCPVVADGTLETAMYRRNWYDGFYDKKYPLFKPEYQDVPSQSPESVG